MTPAGPAPPPHGPQLVLEGRDYSCLRRLREEDRLLFGLGQIHHLPTKRARLRLLESALDAGITWFDVAPAYGNGLAERIIGALPSSLRSKLRVNTKAGLPAKIYPSPLDGVFPLPRLADRLMGTHRQAYLNRDFSPSALRASLDASLRRLELDCIEMFFLHEPIEPFAPGTMEAIQETMDLLKAKGKIRGWGIAGPKQRYQMGDQLPAGIQFQTPAMEWYEEVRAFAEEPPAILYGVHAFSRAMAHLGGMNLLLDTCNQRKEMAKLILATSLPKRITGWFNEEGC